MRQVAPKACVGGSSESAFARHQASLKLSEGYELDRIDFPDHDQAFTAHVGTVRVLAALNTKLPAAAFLQVNSAAEAGLANIRLRNAPREDNDFYLVVNESLNTNRLASSTVHHPTVHRRDVHLHVPALTRWR